MGETATSLRQTLIVGLICLSVIAAGCGAFTAKDGTTTTQPSTTTTDEPEKGDTLLSVTEVNTSTVMQVNESQRTNFAALSERQRAVFLEALNCSWTVQQTVFRFDDADRVGSVKYEGQWYYLRVAIV